MYKIRSLEEVISELGEIPLCQCGCGNKVKISVNRYPYYKKHGYPKYVANHNLIGIKRPEHSLLMSGKGNPMYGNPREDLQVKFKGEGNPMYGKSSWNKGLTKETDSRVKIVSYKLKSVPKSEEHKNKLSEIRIKNNLSKGKNNPFYGKHHTQDAIEIIKNKNIGKIESKETREKKKQISLERWKDQEFRKRMTGKNAWRYGRLPPSECSYGIQSYYDSPLQGTIRLKSSYELAYAKYLDEHKIPWMYEIETFELSDEMTYTPDFYLPRTEEFIEIKGYMKPEQKLKIDKFLQEYPWDLKILFKQDLQNLGINLKR